MSCLQWTTIRTRPFAVQLQCSDDITRTGRVRKLLPIECWRLQGFTDEQFYKAQAAGLSDSRLYKMAGNAVSVPVISALGRGTETYL